MRIHRGLLFLVFISSTRGFIAFSRSFIKRSAESKHYLIIAMSSLSLSQVDSYQRSSINAILSRNTDANGTQTIVLEDSCLYPEGGGQPCDLGTINNVQVVNVTKHGISSRHIEVTLASKIDDDATTATCVVDWKRRYDFMQQHTAQVG